MGTKSAEIHKSVILITGLPVSIHRSDITDLCTPYGDIKECHILLDPLTSKSTGSAFVQFVDPAKVASAVASLDGNRDIADCTLQVIAAQPLHEPTLQRLWPAADPEATLVAGLVRQLQLLSPATLQTLLGQIGSGASPGAEVKMEPSSPTTLPPPGPLPLPGSTKGDTSVIVDESALHSCRIPIFSGDGAKGEVSYSQWKYEVRCLLNAGKPEASILIAVRRSVRGTAAEVMRFLGEQVTTGELLRKFAVTFGHVLTNEQLLGNFYSSKQKPSEHVTVWGCRLEEMLSQLQEQGALTPAATKEMLRTKF